MFLKVICAGILLLISITGFTQNVTVYNKQPDDFASARGYYLVNIIQNNKTYSSYVYCSKAGNSSGQEMAGQQNKTFNYSIFSFTGLITVEVTKLNSTAKYAAIRPNKLGLGNIKTVVGTEGAKARFTLNKPGKISVEFNDDPLNKNAFVLFANAPENTALVPSLAAPNVLVIKQKTDIQNIPADKTTVYFPAGLYEIGYWEIPAFVKQVYLAGGCYLRGYLGAKRAQNNPVIINGRGIISNDAWPFHYPVNTYDQSQYQNWYKQIQIEGGTGSLIEGITLVDATGPVISIHNNNSIIRNININGFKFNNDGITVIGKNNLIDNCFIRDNEDAIVLYSDDISIQNCTFWQLTNGSIIQLGWAPHTMGGLNVVKNCDVLHAEWAKPDQLNMGFINAMNAMSSTRKNAPANATIENFTVSDIRFDTPILRFLDIREGRKWNDQTNSNGWTYKNFSFSNIYLANTTNIKLIMLAASTDKNHYLQNFNFKNIHINNKLITNMDALKGIADDSALRTIKLRP